MIWCNSLSKNPFYEFAIVLIPALVLVFCNIRMTIRVLVTFLTKFQQQFNLFVLVLEELSHRKTMSFKKGTLLPATHSVDMGC